ncbi:MAG: ribulose-phosphate 3-epimerase [Bacteroidales bacterium]
MHRIAPSILTANFLKLEEAVRMVNASEADYLHLDIMDGNFVPNLTFGFPIIKQIKSISEKPLDTHLMILNPDRYLEEFKEAGADNLTVHYETCPHLHRTIQRIKELGMTASVTINPATPVSVLENILPDVFMVLIMSVNPGYGGQKFIPQSVEKIKKLRTMIDESGLDTLIEIDGGVTLNNIGQLSAAGVDVFVVGNTIFSADDPQGMIRKLKNKYQ